MSVVVALKTEDNIYFASETISVSGKMNPEIKNLTKFTNRKFQAFENHYGKVIIGLTGQSIISIGIPELAENILKQMNLSFNIFKPFDHLQLFRVLTKWYNFLIEEGIVQRSAAPSDKVDRSEKLGCHLIIGTEFSGERKLYTVDGYLNISEVDTFGVIGVCTESARVAYDALSQSPDFVNDGSLLPKIIKLCSKYNSMITDDIYTMGIKDMQLNELWKK